MVFYIVNLTKPTKFVWMLLIDDRYFKLISITSWKFKKCKKRDVILFSSKYWHSKRYFSFKNANFGDFLGFNCREHHARHFYVVNPPNISYIIHRIGFNVSPERCRRNYFFETVFGTGRCSIFPTANFFRNFFFAKKNELFLEFAYFSRWCFSTANENFQTFFS